MIDIPLSAKVECVDGLCGQSTAIVVNPVTKDVTYFVVRDETGSSPVERLVPVDQISETTKTLIRLDCGGLVRLAACCCQHGAVC